MALRIALASPTPSPSRETFVDAHIRGLDKVELVLSDGALPYFNGRGEPLVVPSIFDRILGLVHTVDTRQQRRDGIVRLLKKEGIDVLLAEYGSAGAELHGICRSAGVPIVPVFHGYDAYREDMLKRYGVYKELFAGASRIVAVSHAMAEQLKAVGAPEEKLVYNPCGADLGIFTCGDATKAPPHFVTIGRFVDKKAPHLTILAFERVVRSRPDARLTMIGDGELLEACVQLVRALKLTDKVDLCGRKDQAWIGEALLRSRAFVQHSLVTSANDREGTPVAVLEAMAAGLPVVSTRHGDIVEMVKHGERGLLCAEGDIEGMAENMLKLVDDAPLAGLMGRAGSTYVRTEHGVERRASELQNILQEVVDENTKR